MNSTRRGGEATSKVGKAYHNDALHGEFGEVKALASTRGSGINARPKKKPQA